MFDHSAFDSHEDVQFFHDEPSGLRCVIAVHSTALGPAAGGCRMWDYTSSDAMLTDALRLSKGMSYKNAIAGIPFGGGKAVIWGNSKTDKSEDLFLAFGRAVESLNGRYWTAEDVGIDTTDIETARRETQFAAGSTSGKAASGDPSPITALGVYRGMKAAAERVFDSDDLSGKSIAVQGVGSVGGYVCRHLAEEGAKLFICDIDEAALSEVQKETGATIVPPDEIYDVSVDIYSPNALGATINCGTLKRLNAKVIAGGANNQLATQDMGNKLSQAGILYAPDYVINGGGIINVASEISGTYSRDWVATKLDTLIATLGDIFDTAMKDGKSTHIVADEMAKSRIRAARL